MTLVVTVVALGAGAIIDMLTRRIPNALTLATAALGVVLALAGLSHISFAQSLSGLLLGMLLMLPGYLLGATGAGDVKLLGAAGAVLGVTRVPAAFLYAAIAGGAFALVVAATRGRLLATMSRLQLAAVSAARRRPDAAVASRDARASDRFFAYAPAIAVGCVLAALGL